MATEPLAFPPAPDGDPWGETPLEELPIIAFDTETGGLDPRKDPLLTVGLACPDGPVLVATVHHERYQPKAAVLDINRITTRWAEHGSPWPLIEGLVRDQLDGRVVLGHNVGFDLRFLITNAPDLSLPAAIDTAAVARFLWPGEKATLRDVCGRYGIEVEGAHGAGADAWAASRAWIYLRAALSHRGIDTWNKLCAARAPIPARMDRRPWPDEVAAAIEAAGQRGVDVGSAAV
jgi:DNA polymerase III epsilon subunit-like protein